MSNIFCDIATFQDYYDTRQLGMLLRDDNGRALNVARAQKFLDAAASKLMSYLGGRYGPLPFTIADGSMPAMLTQYVADQAMKRSYLRRSDMPKEIADAIEASDKWLQDIVLGAASIVDNNGNQVSPTNVAALDSSDNTQGISRFDGLPGFSPPATKTSTSRGL